VGFKKDAAGQVVVSRLNMATLEAIARGTGGRAFRITPADTSLSALASIIEGMEQKALAGEYSYRRKERFQAPLALGLLALTLALAFPGPRLDARGSAPQAARAAALLFLLLALKGSALAGQTSSSVSPLPAQPSASPSPASPSPLDEVLLRPPRLTAEGRAEYERGNQPQALSAFEGAARMRPQDPRARFNLADALYKSGKFDEAEALFRALAEGPPSPLAPAARFNLGNARFQKQDYPGAIQAYRDTLHLAPGDEEAKRNLELALRALQKQKQQQQEQNQSQRPKEDERSKKGGGGKDDRPPGQNQDRRTPKTPEEKQEERFRQETGMPKERAMQLLDALKENESIEQKKLLNARRAERKRVKDW
jgi:tetratricopeptide (TPR) repeat protein